MEDFDSFLHYFLEHINPEVLIRRFGVLANDEKNASQAEMTTENFKLIHLIFTGPEGDDVKSTLDYDKVLYSEAADYFNNPSTKITNEISDLAQLNKYLNMLRTAVVQIRNNREFFDDYPQYVTAIIKLGITLKEIQEVFDKPLKPIKSNTGQTGDKTAKAVELKEYLTIIENSGDHEEAIEKIRERHPEFEYPNPHHKLFQYKDDKLIIKRACIALEKIGKIKWKDNGPNWETIKKVLFQL